MMATAALISDCGRYRHWLRREWSGPGWGHAGSVVFVMLNPSTADANVDDPTIRKCVGFAQRLGYGGIYVVNLCDYRATKPADLRAAVFPVSKECDHHIAEVARDRDVICAWGTWGAPYPHRVRAIREPLHRANSVRALKLTKQGHPQHPLYIPYDVRPVEFRP